MQTLITFPANFGSVSASPFCIKAAWLLKWSGQPWARQDMNDPRKMPHGKLPVLQVGTVMHSGSDAIATYLQTRGADFWGDIAPQDRATGQAFIRMAEDHMYFHLVMDRWGNDAVWPVIRDAYFADIPAILRGFITGRIRARALEGVRWQGIGRLTGAERMLRLEPDLQAISVRVAEGFLLGDSPTLADVSVASVLEAMAACPVKTTLSARVSEDAVLMAYVGRMKAIMA